MNTVTFAKTAPPEWLLAMWKEIDDKSFGKGFDCFAEDAIRNLGVADWHGREAIRNNLREFIDKGLAAHHEIVVRPTMTWTKGSRPRSSAGSARSVGPTGF